MTTFVQKLGDLTTKAYAETSIKLNLNQYYKDTNSRWKSDLFSSRISFENKLSGINGSFTTSLSAGFNISQGFSANFQSIISNNLGDYNPSLWQNATLNVSSSLIFSAKESANGSYNSNKFGL